MLSLHRVRAVLLTALAGAISAQAASINYLDFASVDGLTLGGDAARSGNVLQLTPASDFQTGTAYSTTPVALGFFNSFSTYFRFRISNNGGIADGDGFGGDGLAFVLQTTGNTAGFSGSGLGYGGVNPSFAVEFDTYLNVEHEQSGNHVGLNFGGDLQSFPEVDEDTRFNNGEIWHVWIDFNGETGQFEVRTSLNGQRPVDPSISLANLDLINSQFGRGATVFAGFTSATGSAFSTHDILSWEFRDSFSPIGAETAVPEPSTGALAALALGGLVWWRRRSS